MKLIAIIILLFLQTIFVLVAAWQIFGLLPVFSWFGSSANITAGMWLAVGIKGVILLASVLFWWLCGRLRAKVNGVKRELTELNTSDA